MKKIILLIIVLNIPIFLFAQNLVPNPSFEDTLWCPNNGGQINAANHWYSPWGGGSSELLHPCNCNLPPLAGYSPGYVCIPKSIFGYQYARTGDAYAGIIMFGGLPFEYRENIEVCLTAGLNPYRAYYIEFYVSLCDKAAWAISNIGAYFSKNQLSGSGSSNTIMNLTPQFEYSGSPIIDTMNWIKISGYFKVQEEGTQYMTIGNFADSGQTNYQTVNYGGVSSYYFIDDVLVMDSVQYAQGYGINELGISNQELVIYPNPANSQLNIELENLNQDYPVELEFYNCMGSLVKSLQIKQNKSSVDVSDLPQGLYIIAIKRENEIIARDRFVISR